MQIRLALAALVGTLLGGITFRNVLVRYDRAARRVGFSHATCRDLGQAQRPPCPLLANEGIAAVSQCSTCLVSRGLMCSSACGKDRQCGPSEAVDSSACLVAAINGGLPNLMRHGHCTVIYL